MSNNGQARIQPVEITEEMERSYLDYAMSVIVARALPDVKDGLKPVQRRIIYAMYQQGLRHSSRYTKSAAVVGEVLKHYHPHGDVSVYDALVRMAQEFSLRYPLIDGQGNFGCFTKDTKVKLVDDRSLNFEELIKESTEGKRNFTYTFNPKTKKIEVAEIKKPRLTRRRAELVEVELDNGQKIKCTPNHPFMLRTGSYKEASKLEAGSSLMPIYTRFSTVIDDPNISGYEMIYQPLKNNWDFTHQLADNWNLRHKIYLRSAGKIRHHLDFNKLNNSPLNVVRLSWKKHWKIHYSFTSNKHKFNAEYVKKLAEGRNRFWNNEENRKVASQRLSERNAKNWKNLAYCQKKTKAFKKLIADPEFKAKLSEISRQQLKKLWQDQAYKQKMSWLKSQELKLRWRNPVYRKFFSDLMSQLSPKIWSNPNHREFISQKSKEHWQNPIYRQKMADKGRKQWADQEYKNYMINCYQNKWKSDKQFRNFFLPILTENGRMAHYYRFLQVCENVLKNHDDLTSQTYEIERKRYGSRNGEGIVKLNKAINKYFNGNYNLLFETVNQSQEIQSRLNHKVVKVKFLNELEDVYDLTIEKIHNFALDAGVFVHNSIDGDPPAAMRYSEARLAAISEELLYDLEKKTVDWIDNYSGTTKEPAILPATLPNLLLNGATGIAVGMATNIPPHNLSEVCQAAIYLTENPEASVEDLTKIIKGPDFPTGAAIFDAAEITAAYATGRGTVLMRAKAEIEETGSGRFQIIITELPFQVNKASLVTRIAELVKAKKIEGISDLRDDSDRRGLRIVVELKKDAKPQSVLNNLYKYTALQSTFPVNMVALVDGTPQTLTLPMILTEYVKHRQIVVTKRSEFELDEAKKRAHILEGLKIAVDNIDLVIETIKKSKDAETAQVKLIEKFKLTTIQAQAILDMQLKRLAALERAKIEDELIMTKEEIEYLEQLLADPAKIRQVLVGELEKLIEKFGDERRTKVYKRQVGEFSEEDLVANEPCIITATASGYIKRQPIGTFKTQRRGGKGVVGITTKEEDVVSQLLSSWTHDQLLFFTNVGRVYAIPAYDIGEASRTSKGAAVINLIDISQDEKILTILPVSKTNNRARFVLMMTKNGTVKKTPISGYATIRRSGIIAIKLEGGDQLRWAKLTSGEDDIFLISSAGQSIRFSEKDIRATGRATIGVRGIRLRKNDEVIGMDVLDSADFKADLLVVSQNGLGKRTQVGQWQKQKRGGVGVKAVNITDRTGKLVCAQIVSKQHYALVLTSQSGQVIRLPVNNIPRLGRATQGVTLMRFTNKNDKVAAATCFTKEKEEVDREKAKH